MATLLSRLGRMSYRRRGPVLLTWLLLLVLAAVGATTLSGPTSGAFSIPGTESQRALDLLAERMPQAAPDGAIARVVFVGEQGAVVSDDARRAISEVVADLQDLPDVTGVVDPYAAQAVSPDGSTAYATVSFAVPAMELTETDRDGLLAVAAQAEQSGLTVEVGGDAVQEPVHSGGGEVIGLGVAAVVLALTFGSLVAAGLPLVTAVVGVGLGVLGITVATGFLELSTTTSALASMIGLAVAIDYALFIVSRHRHELLVGRSGQEAAARAVGTAGSAVVFAGATVVIALAALSVVGIPFLTQMGLAAAATVLVAVLVALTLVPALLGVLGDRVLGRAGRAARDTEGDDGTSPLGERWARFVLRHRLPVVLATVLGLGLVAVPALDLRLALPSEGTAAPESTQRQAYDALAAGFGPGVNGPLLVALDTAAADDPASAAQGIAADLAGLDGIVAVTPPAFDAGQRTAVLTAIPATAPDSVRTEELVRAIRALSDEWGGSTGTTVYVTGATAIAIDVSQRVADALLPYLAVVVGLALVLLVLVFRSVLVPVKATLGFLLSVAAAFGAVVAVFQWGWLADLVGVSATGPVLSFLPIFLIGVLFGLAMDYEVFLVTRMREEHVHGAPADVAVVQGFRHSARVVSAAGVIMLSVFAGFVGSPDVILKSIGFGLAVGVLFDAFVVRMTLVPAVMSLLGDRAWWLPAWLDRLLPHVDVEGTALAAPALPEERAPELVS